MFLKKQRWSFLCLSLCIGAAFVSACGSDTGDGEETTRGGGAGGAGGNDEPVITVGVGGNGPVAGLQITPVNPVLSATGSPVTTKLTAVRTDGGSLDEVTWEVGDVSVGTISPDGVFRSEGLVAGATTVTARSGSLKGSTVLKVLVNIRKNQGGVSQEVQDALVAGGNADAQFRWLYPYDKTVFPQGLRAPVLQFGGAAADATYLRISLPNFVYEGFFGASNPTRIELPQDVWRALTKSAGATDSVSVQVSKISDGNVTGPASVTWTIAPGVFKGIIYYNTYKSAQTSEGAVMRMRPNKNAEVLLGGCTVCHSVSANGNVLAAGLQWDKNPVDSASYTIKSDGSSSVRHKDGEGRKTAFGALTPQGEWLLSNGVVNTDPKIRGFDGTFPSKLYDTTSGVEVPAPSFSNEVQYALTPAFSPDGKRVAFNWRETAAGKTLAMMAFDGNQSPPVFSNLQTLVTAQGNVAAWPSFVPDGGAVVYHDGDAFDTVAYPAKPSYAEVRLVDIAAKKVVDMKALNGRRPDGSIYLPYGDDEEERLNYEPTVLPVAVGGYYWVVFTSRRAYGNLIAPGGTVPGGDNKWGVFISDTTPTQEIPSVRKKLWAAAIDINYQGKADPSHPAFYLGEQELEAGNMRAFAALEPCKAEGGLCESAAECCGGFCRQTGQVNEDGTPVTACMVSSTTDCSNVDELCNTAEDCCDSSFLCINNRCSVPPVK